MTVEPPAAPGDADLLGLRGSAVLVLGAGSGIGRAAAESFARAGALVACADLDLDAVTEVAAGIDGLPLRADATVRGDIEAALARTVAEIGPLRTFVDVVGAPVLGLLDDLDETAWRRQFALVLDHAVYGLQACAPLLEEAGGGSAVFVGSSSGNDYFLGQAAYGTAKAALHHFILAAGRELAPRGIRVNGIAPGATRTPALEKVMDPDHWERAARQIPLQVVAEPSDMGSAILFLASDLARHITGEVIPVDGGRSHTMKTLAVPEHLRDHPLA